MTPADLPGDTPPATLKRTGFGPAALGGFDLPGDTPPATLKLRDVDDGFPAARDLPGDTPPATLKPVAPAGRPPGLPRTFRGILPRPH